MRLNRVLGRALTVMLLLSAGACGGSSSGRSPIPSTSTTSLVGSMPTTSSTPTTPTTAVKRSGLAVGEIAFGKACLEDLVGKRVVDGVYQNDMEYQLGTMSIVNPDTGATRESQMGCLEGGDAPWYVSADGRYIYFLYYQQRYVYDLVEGRGVQVAGMVGDLAGSSGRPGFETVYSISGAAERMGGSGLDAETVEIDDFTISTDGSKAGFHVSSGSRNGWFSMPISGLFDKTVPSTEDPAIDPLKEESASTCNYQDSGDSITFLVHGKCEAVKVIPGTRWTVWLAAIPLGKSYSHVDFWASDGNHYRYDIDAGKSELIGPTLDANGEPDDGNQMIVVSARSG